MGPQVKKTQEYRNIMGPQVEKSRTQEYHGTPSREPQEDRNILGRYLHWIGSLFGGLGLPKQGPERPAAGPLDAASEAPRSASHARAGGVPRLKTL